MRLRKVTWKSPNCLSLKVLDVNAMAFDSRTPLHNAAWGGHKEITELFIANGADVNAKSEAYGTPLDVAIKYNHTETADLLRKHGGKTKKELEAAGNPTEPVAEAAKPEPSTAKAPDISIHDAAFKGNIKAVKKHLADGADVNAKDVDGDTPLDWATHPVTQSLRRNRRPPPQTRRQDG